MIFVYKPAFNFAQCVCMCVCVCGGGGGGGGGVMYHRFTGKADKINGKFLKNNITNKV